jgi:hypothetical protein
MPTPGGEIAAKRALERTTRYTGQQEVVIGPIPVAPRGAQN